MQKIGFCDRYGLTKAVLNGTKTMTRRLEKALERTVEDYKKKYSEEPVIKYQEWVKEGNFLRVHCEHALLSFQTRYKLGEVVAVAQAYKDIEEYNPDSYEDVMLDQGTICESSHPYSHLMRSGGWDNKMFVRPDLMPHQIKITDIRIERLHDISDEDCIKEGILHSDKYAMPYGIPDSKAPNGGFFWHSFPREAFAALINRPGVGRKGLWESNPFVVVYEFKLLK